MKPSRLMLAAACIAMLAVPQKTIAQVDTFAANFVMEGCRESLANTGNSYIQRGYCYGAITAIISVGSGVCPPKNSTVAQGVRVVVAYIDARPARQHEEFSKLAQEALRQAWPCR